MSGPDEEPARVAVNPNARAAPHQGRRTDSVEDDPILPAECAPLTIAADPPPQPANSTPTGAATAGSISPPPDAPPPSPSDAASFPPAPIAVADVAVPCATCGYDLRGRPGGARCPECGATIPLRSRPQSTSFASTNHRDALFNCWYGLSASCVFPALLITPLVFLVPLGVGAAVCLGFGPLFRLAALRGLDALPPVILGPARSGLVMLRRLERAQLVIAGLVALGAALATMSALGPWAVPLYHVALVVWWLVSLAALRTQVRFGDQLSRRLVEQDTLPLEIPQRISKGLLATLAFGAIVAAVLIASAILTLSSSTPSRAGSGFGVAVACFAPLVGFAGHLACAWGARAHAILVANCAFESPLLRVDPNRRTADEGEGPNALPISQRHSFTPRGDEAPIRLPGD